MSVVSGILKLGPGNPILLRVVTAGGRRLRHAFTRWGYLGLLIMVLLIALLVSTAGSGKSLSELAKASTQVFKYISYVQLGMICLLAPVFCAAAITQERDARTYNILLATPLTNAQIVLGSLFSRLYYIVALLLSGAPVFAITLFYGGVTGGNITTSFAIALTTAFFTGSLAIAIAVFRLGSGKTVFWFYVFNAIYLVGLYMLDLYLREAGGTAAHTTWLTGAHPFLALESVVSPTAYPTPDPTAMSDTFVLLRWYLAYPAYAYLALTSFLSLALVVPSAIVLRRIAQRSEAGLWSFVRNIIMRGKEARGRRVRTVWNNPVAWREAATRAGFSGRGLTRWITLLVGLAAAVVVLYFYHDGTFDVINTRRFLLGLILVEFSVSLLVATNTSASAVTRERESETLDLLLVTPITSRYYIWGKLRGLVSFMIPFVAVPTLTILLVILYDSLAGMRVASDTRVLVEVMNTATGHPEPVAGFWPRFMAREWVVFPETLITLPLMLTAILAWSCMLGLQLSLKWSRTLVAVMASVGVLAGICSVLGVCGFAAAYKMSGFGLVVAAFSPFTSVCVLVNPQDFAESSFGPSGTFSASNAEGYPGWIGRSLMAGAVVVAVIAYCLLVWTMYRSMVRNFDMIIRRQHS